MAKRWIARTHARTNKHKSWLMQSSCGVRCAVVQAVSADRADAQSCADALHNNDQTETRVIQTTRTRLQSDGDDMRDVCTTNLHFVYV